MDPAADTELLDEVSKGRAKPMTYSALAVHMTHLRRKGFAIRREVVYSVGGVQPPGSTDAGAPNSRLIVVKRG